MNNQDKLKQLHKSQVRQSIFNHGVWNGVVKYHDEHKNTDKLVYATLTSFATLNDPNLLEFYNLMS